MSGAKKRLSELSDLHLIVALRVLAPPAAHPIIDELQKRLHRRTLEVIQWKREAGTKPFQRK